MGAIVLSTAAKGCPPFHFGTSNTLFYNDNVTQNVDGTLTCNYHSATGTAFNAAAIYVTTWQYQTTDGQGVDTTPIVNELGNVQTVMLALALIACCLVGLVVGYRFGRRRADV